MQTTQQQQQTTTTQRLSSSTFHLHLSPLSKEKRSPPAKMKRNIVIFLIIILLFLFIALIAYGIYYLQTRMAVGGTASTTSGSEMTSVV